MKPFILIVIPTYGHFEYAADAVRSALRNTTCFDPYVLVVDDASPDWPPWVDTGPDSQARPVPGPLYDVFSEFPTKVDWHRFEENGGLTRSWNRGLWEAGSGDKYDFACVTNSDVVFAEHWDHAIFEALRPGKNQVDLVGPVTNAPGTETSQYVGRYSTLYDPTHPQKDIDAVQRELTNAQGTRTKTATLNGFCMVANTRTWWANPFDPKHVFCPRNDFNSKGERNPTPLMTLNEYELQRRWHEKGLTSAVCLGSYVFHYRAVSRGDKHKRGDWVRKK